MNIQLSQTDRSLGSCLAQWGMKPDDVTVYMLLLGGKRRTFQSILVETRISPEAVRNALKRLEMLCLVAETTDGKRNRFRATDPNNTWTALIYDNNWRGANNTILSEPDPDAAPKRRLLEDIRELTVGHYANSNGNYHEKEFESSDMFALVCCHAIKAASNQLLAVESYPPLPQIAFFWPAILGIKKRNLPYTRYATLKEVLLHGIDIVSRDVEDIGIDLNIVLSDPPTRSVYLVDQKKIFIFDYDEEHEKFTATASNNPHVVKRYVRNEIQPIIHSACSFLELRGALSDLILQRRNEVRQSHLPVFDRVCAMGKFATLEPEHFQAAADLVEEGVLIKERQGFALRDIFTNKLM